MGSCFSAKKPKNSIQKGNLASISLAKRAKSSEEMQINAEKEVILPKNTGFETMGTEVLSEAMDKPVEMKGNQSIFQKDAGSLTGKKGEGEGIIEKKIVEGKQVQARGDSEWDSDSPDLTERQSIVYGDASMHEHMEMNLVEPHTQDLTTLWSASLLHLHPILRIPVNYLDSTYDKDFTQSLSSSSASRDIPVGWYQYGLRVLGKYSTDDWLSNASGWKVGYHGASFQTLCSIIEYGYKDWSYCTQSVTQAENYARAKRKQGDKVMVLVNRVHVSVENRDGVYVAVVGSWIRPYGILVKSA